MLNKKVFRLPVTAKFRYGFPRTSFMLKLKAKKYSAAANHINIWKIRMSLCEPTSCLAAKFFMMDRTYLKHGHVTLKYTVRFVLQWELTCATVAAQVYLL